MQRICAGIWCFHTTQHLMSASNTLPKTHSPLGIPTSGTSQWQGDARGLSCVGEIPAYSGITEPQPAQKSNAGCRAAVTTIPIKTQDGQYVTEWLRLEKVVRLFFSPLSLHFNIFFPIPSLCLVHQIIPVGHHFFISCRKKKYLYLKGPFWRNYKHGIEPRQTTAPIHSHTGFPYGLHRSYRQTANEKHRNPSWSLAPFARIHTRLQKLCAKAQPPQCWSCWILFLEAPENSLLL